MSLGNFNVLVGPNNCGKSQTLRDIRDYVATGSTEALIIVNQIDVKLPAKADGIKAFSISPHPTPKHIIVRGVSYDLQKQYEFNLDDNWIDERFCEIDNAKNIASNTSELLHHLGKYWVAHLDAESRLQMASPTPCYDTRIESPSNAMQAFFAGGDEPVAELRHAFNEAFGIDIALDWSAMKTWYLMVGSDFGEIPDTRAELAALLQPARQLVVQGDGYRSFAGVVLAMLTFSDRLLLFDEPDAFLHPAQARVLGRWLATYSKKASAQILLATHNADFLWGILSSDPDAKLIRLDRTNNTTRYHALPPATTKSLVESPLLSSQPVLDSLFQKGVAVCEGDPDRAIYQTVAHRYVKKDGGEDVLFIHANGKDALKNPVEMLRNAGTAVCAIVDLDVLNSEEILRDLLSLFITEPQITEILTLRAKIASTVQAEPDAELIANLQASVDEWRKEPYTDLREARKRLGGIADKFSKWQAVKKSGIEHFGEADRTEVQDFINKCAAVGLFVVSKGELESLIPIEASKGKGWNRKALQELHDGQCPDDLKKFVQDIVKFLVSP